MDLSYLQRILGGGAGGDVPADELCAAVIRHGWIARGEDDGYLRDSGGRLAAILGPDFDRLQRILRLVMG